MTRFSNEQLDAMRTQGDRDADLVIAKLAGDQGIAALNTLLRNLVRNDDIASIPLPDIVARYLSSTSRLPPDVDFAKLRRGHALFERYAPEICWLLACASLPLCYACEDGSKVLEQTMLLTDATNAERRIFETAQFVLDVMDPDGFAPEGYGFRTIQKVRLMHASIRHFLLVKAADDTSPVQWDAAWGTPVNQEDLANTLISFSVMVLEGLETFRLEVSPDEADAYLYLWNQIGLLLGVLPELLPRDLTDGRELMHQIASRNWKKGPAGKALMKALIAFGRRIVPGRLLDGIFPASIRLCFKKPVDGKSLPDVLDVPPSPVTERLQRALVVGLDAIEDKIAILGLEPPLRSVTRYLGLELLQGYLKIQRGGRRPPFRIPERLKSQLFPQPQAAE